MKISYTKWKVSTQQRSSSLRVEESTQVRESEFRKPENFCLLIPESWKFLLVESRILDFGTQNIAVGIRNPSSTEKDVESSNWNPESTAWNPESLRLSGCSSGCSIFDLGHS